MLKRRRYWLLAVLLVCVLAAAFLFERRQQSQLRQALQQRFEESPSVATLEIDPAGTIRMFLNPDDSIITPRIQRDGVWEPNETHWFTRFIGRGDTVIDIGANVGYYTLLASRLVGEHGRVYAFEPDPIAFALLEQNVRLNEARNVVLEQKAVSNENGSIQLFLAPDNKGDHRIYQTAEGRPAIDIDAVRLDDYLAEVDGRVDFVKIDTQGAEALIIAGMRQTIDAHPNIVMAVEFWPQGLQGLGSDAAELLQQLSAHDFRMFDLGPGLPGVKDLWEVSPAGMLRTHTVTSRTFTNLLVFRSFEELQALATNVDRARRELAAVVARELPRSDAERSARAALEGAEAAFLAYRNDIPVRR